MPYDPAMRFPTMEEVEKADSKQLACWCRGLSAGDPTPAERRILNRISMKRYGVDENSGLVEYRRAIKKGGGA